MKALRSPLSSPLRRADITPASTPGRALWLDASRLGLANGAAAVSVPDLSGNGFDLIQPNASWRAAFNAAGRNGLGTLDFDGTGDHYFNTSNVWPLDAVTFLAAVCPGASGEFFGDYSSGGDIRWHFYNEAGVIKRFSSGPAAAVTPGSWCLIEYWAAGTSESLRVNGGAVVTTNTRSAGGTRAFCLASLISSGTPALPQALKLGELLVLSRVAPEWERRTLGGYLRRKWATP